MFANTTQNGRSLGEDQGHLIGFPFSELRNFMRKVLLQAQACSGEQDKPLLGNAAELDYRIAQDRFGSLAPQEANLHRRARSGATWAPALVNIVGNI